MNKLNTFLEIYIKTLRIDKRAATILKELAINWINYYSDVFPYISVEDDLDELFIIKPVNGRYSLEDYFLNKLMRNILYFNYSTERFLSSKGSFSPSLHTIAINEEFIKDSILKAKREIEEMTGQKCAPNFDVKIYIKVIMHEFEHGLKVSYAGRVDEKDFAIIQELSRRISKTSYANLCKPPEELTRINSERRTNEYWLHNGMNHHNMRGNTIDFVDEVSNENESLIMSNATMQINSGNDEMYYPLKNVESSSSFFCNTVAMFGIIFGKDNLFSLSYLKPDSIEDFNQRFNYIFQTEFLMEDSAFEIFCLKLKECTDLRKKLKLEEVLLKCFYLELKQRCDQDLNKAIETWKLLKASTLHFTDEIMNRYKNNSKIEFFKIYSEIEQYILDKTKKNTMSDSSTLPFN